MNPICKICGAGTTPFLDPQFNVIYHECGKCEFIFKDDRAVVSAEEEQREYDLHNNSYENEGYVNMFRDFMVKSIEGYVTGSGDSKGRRALDFGSGPEPVLAKVLTEEYGYATDIYDFYYAPDKVYEGNTYDLLTCTEVVEHLKDPMAYFALFRSLLKEDGLLAVMTLFHPKDEHTFCKWHYRREKTHTSFYTTKTMETIAQLLGMKVLYTDGRRYCTFGLS